MSGRLHLGLSLSPTWWRGERWHAPDSRVEELYSAGFYLDLARRAERAALDFLFKPDALLVNPEVLPAWPGTSSLDPTLMMTAIAIGTSRIGLVTTMSTTFYPPFIAARQLQSLSRLSGGRAGWNLVTAVDGQRNFGLDEMPPSSELYAAAEEFVDVVRALWRSYPSEALAIDRTAGTYVHPGTVRPVAFEGEHFRVEGPLTLAGPSEMPIFQAGASEAGRRLATRVAAAVFAATPEMGQALELRTDLRRRAGEFGRDPGAVRVMPGLGLRLVPTQAEAEQLRVAPPEEPAGAGLRGTSLRQQLPPLHAGVTGTPDDAFRFIVEWFEAGAVDGFILLPGTLLSIDLFLDEVVPRLVAAGMFRAEYEGETLREHLGIG